DNTIKLPKDVINTMQLPVLAAIPDFSRKVK
ncbi:MAG: lipopolysaccharide biosynthesis protein, partial [Dethiobacter sp.]